MIFTPKNVIKYFIFFLIFIFLISFLFSSNTHLKNKESLENTNKIIKKEIIYLKTPENLKVVYMSACFASNKSLRENLVKLVDETEINSIMIDVKDYTGTVSFLTGDKEIDGLNGSGCKINDLEDFIKYLKDKNIYTIARITVFQDPTFTKNYPSLAVKRKSDGGVWVDRKGISFVDVGAKPFWDYIVSISKYSHDIGFDEINFDYIRFPSDGNMRDIDFPHTGTTTKKEMLKKFFEYLDNEMAKKEIVSSADVFGMTTTNTDDLNIGQVLEYALLNFDFVAPMVYPSHYPNGFNGWQNPNEVPYKIIKFSMDSAVARNLALKKEVLSKMYIENASSSTKEKTNFYNERIEKRLSKKQIRPWLQDFDYPVPYTTNMVKEQIKAVYDAGLSSWMLWDPSNKYTKEALILE